MCGTSAPAYAEILGEMVKEQEKRFEAHAELEYHRVVAERDANRQATRTVEKDHCAAGP